MKKTRSILATLLVIVLLCSLLPSSVLAASISYKISLSTEYKEVEENESLMIYVDINSAIESTYNSVYVKNIRHNSLNNYHINCFI